MSLNGLNRHSTAPCSSSRVRTVLSVVAVMKMIGISRPRRDNYGCMYYTPAGDPVRDMPGPPLPLNGEKRQMARG